MIAHFVGGPLHGVDRAVEEDRRVIEVYVLDHPPAPVPSWEREYAGATDIHFHAGEYRRIGLNLPQDIFTRVPVPAIFVWVDEQEQVKE